ncbi:MAG: NTPase [Thermosphaera sp.]
MNIVITGRPGVGKSTVFLRVITHLKERGEVLTGFRTPEVREGGIRVGFKIVDLNTGEEAWLAKRNADSTVRVGSYGVLVSEASELIRKSLETALKTRSIVGIDEIGPMELKLPVFKPLLLRILEKETVKILVVHERLSDKEILSRLGNAAWYEITESNRGKAPSKIIEELETRLRNY